MPARARSSPRRTKSKRNTPVATRRRDERAARVDWILDAALELATRDGIGAVTITNLAEHLGYTVGAFYRYFPSLDALLAELHWHTAELFYGAAFDLLTAARAKLAASSQGSLGNERTRALAELVLLPALYRNVADAHPRHFELVNQLVTRSAPWLDSESTRRTELQQLVMPRVLDLVDVVARAMTAGAISRDGEPAVRMMTLWLGAHAALAVGPLARQQPGLFDRDLLLSTMVRSLLLGWGAAPAQLDAALAIAHDLVPPTPA